MRSGSRDYLRPTCLLFDAACSLVTSMFVLLAHNRQRVQSIVNEFFSECFNSTLPPLNNDDWNNIRTNQDECPTDTLCSENEVLEMLCSLNTRKSNGPDGISARMLKSCAGSISLPIKMIFNHSLRSGQLPCAWKESNVTQSQREMEHLVATGQYHSCRYSARSWRDTYRTRYVHILLHITHYLCISGDFKEENVLPLQLSTSQIIGYMKWKKILRYVQSSLIYKKLLTQCHITLCYISCAH